MPVSPATISPTGTAVAAGAAAGPPLVLPPGEATKSFAHLTQVSNYLLDLRLERGDAVVALGGGVIGDLAGFAASILKRGVRFVQIPTTLLAQVDSSVGGKTGINTEHGKNLIGTFHQPSLVIADLDTLATLEPRELRAGYAEVVKYGLLDDAAFFEWLETSGAAVLAREAGALGHAVEVSCRAKAAIVAEDERESGRRALLNLGHSFAHAFEAWAGYSGALLHGEAVAIGMVLAFELSEELGLCTAGESPRVAAHLKAAGLPASLGDLQRLTNRALPSAGELAQLMAQDKKMSGGRLTLVLARRIGEALLSRDVSDIQMVAFLDARLASV
jgi:3-dehydroquinate synthase